MSKKPKKPKKQLNSCWACSGRGKLPTKKQLKKYEVTIVREIEYRAVIEVEAESEDVAKQMALNVADNGNPYSNRWMEGDVLSQTFRTKVIS